MLEAHWPKNEAVRECLKVDAESADPAVLLAVHQPMRLQRKDFGAKSVPELCDEGRVLEALLAPTGDGRVIVPIVGNSGVGKSHVIRWLDAQLQFAPGHENRVVVRISKGQSLKGVLSKLLDLEQLNGVRFQQIRERLNSARDKMSEDDAANLLCESLAQRVREASEDAKQETQRGNTTELRKLQKALGADRCLPWLLRDPALRTSHWLKRPDGAKGPLSKLVEPFTDTVEADRSDARKRDFDPDDFVLDAGLDIVTLGEETRKALAMMTLHTPDGRKNATLVLNASLDDAKRTILGLEATVAELFDEVRVELLAVGKELILLIEDFAVLSGMQKQLLQAVIREGTRDGKQVRCTLRTALAYTEGTVSFLFDDTYKSRAKTEWLVPEEESGSIDDVVERAASLVAAYLHAARIGVAGLREALTVAPRDERGGLTGDWVPPFDVPISEREEDVLDAFNTRNGRCIFPLNRAALARLIRENCQSGRTLAYNPRLILQGAVLKTLECRHEFLSTPPRFPGPAFVTGEVKTEPAVEDLLKDVGVSSLEKQRLRRTLAYWYDDAKTPTDLKAKSTGALEAFGIEHGWLGKLKGGKTTVRPPVSPVPPVGPPRIPAGPPGPQERGVIELWEEDLSAWRSASLGRALGGDRSSKLRNLIAKSLDGAIDWQWFNLRMPAAKVEEISKFVFLPNASGGVANQKPADAVAVLCSPEDLDDATRSADAQETALAMLRFFEVYEQSWDYEGAEYDAARYCGFIEAQARQAMAFVRSRPMGPEADPIPLLASGLALAARCNGVPAARSIAHEELLAGMFNAELGTEALNRNRTPGDPWDDLTLTFSTWSWGKKGAGWSDWLLDLVAARQGGEPLAINAAKLKAALDRLCEDWELAAPTVPLADAIKKRAQETEASHQGSLYPNPRNTKVAKALAGEVTRLEAWLGRASSELGDVHDAMSVTEVKDAVDEALEACVSAGYSYAKVQEVRTAGAAFRADDVPRLLAGCRELISAVDRGTQLALRSQHDVDQERKVTAWLDKIAAFYKSIEERVVPAPKGASADPVAAEIQVQVKAVRLLETEFQDGGQP
jgi:hypothetical protein